MQRKPNENYERQKDKVKTGQAVQECSSAAYDNSTQTCGYVTLHGKRGFSDVINLWCLGQGYFPGLSNDPM